MRDNENALVLSGILFVITAVVAFMLSFANSVTADKIAANTIKAQEEARNEVMPDADGFSLKKISEEGIVREIFSARSGGKQIGWCVSVAPNGYGGEVNFIVGLDNEFKLTGVKIISMSETPGLGAKVNEDKFLSQFKGKNAKDGMKVIKSGDASEDEIMAITGATVTSNAVKSGINAAIEAVKEEKGE